MIGRREPDLDDGGPLFGVRPGMPDDEYDRLAAFSIFHAENPQVYVRLRELALAQIEAGASHGGIAQLFEVLRYEASLETSGEAFKLNNSHRAHYARLLMRNEPRLRGFFETRVSAADGRHA